LIIFVKPLLSSIAIPPDIIDALVTYIRIECTTYALSTLLSFALVVLITTNKEKYLLYL